MTKIFWYRFLTLLFLVLVQFSIVTLLFPESPFPSLLMNTVMAFVLVRGFRESLGEWLTLLVLYDLLRFGEFSLLLPYGIILAYLTSFISRRFVFEHRGMGALLLSCIAVLFVSGYGIFVALFFSQPIQWKEGVFDAIIAGLTFFPIFSLIEWFERRLEALSRSEFRSLRH